MASSCSSAFYFTFKLCFFTIKKILNLDEILPNAILLFCQIWGPKARQKLVSESFGAFLLIPEALGAVASAVSLSQNQASIANLSRYK